MRYSLHEKDCPCRSMRAPHWSPPEAASQARPPAGDRERRKSDRPLRLLKRAPVESHNGRAARAGSAAAIRGAETSKGGRHVHEWHSGAETAFSGADRILCIMA